MFSSPLAVASVAYLHISKSKMPFLLLLDLSILASWLPTFKKEDLVLLHQIPSSSTRPRLLWDKISTADLEVSSPDRQNKQR